MVLAMESPKDVDVYEAQTSEPEDTGLPLVGDARVGKPPKDRQKNGRETFDARPDFEAPRNAKRLLQSWTQCRHCQRWYAAPNKKLYQGKSIYCSVRCSASNFAATGRFAGANNPRWIGGVSTDNMRYRNRQKEREPVEEAARRAAQNAIKRGDLVRQPCEKCGADGRIEAHHDDYTRPLEVRWLCRKHHTEHHNGLRQEKRDRGEPATRASPTLVRP